MIVGLILLGMTLGTVLGIAALISGASLAVDITIYAVAGSLWILGAIAILSLSTTLTDAHHAEQVAAQRMNSAQS
ncbi:MAG: hypothetical protein AAF709_12465 [Pseudomonadota bacterium]